MEILILMTNLDPFVDIEDLFVPMEYFPASVFEVSLCLHNTRVFLSRLINLNAGDGSFSSE